MGATTYLMDSQALLFALTSPRSLSTKARRLITNPQETILATAATAYELGYKFRRGKLSGFDRLFVGYEHHVNRVATASLGITTEHALTAASLDWDHRDPFDRLIAAQALVEGAMVITADTAMHDFEPLSTVW